MNSTGNVGNFAIGTPGTGGMRGVGASIMGGSGTGHPLVPQVKLSHLRSPTLEDSVMSSNGAYSAVNSGVIYSLLLKIYVERTQTEFCVFTQQTQSIYRV
jgi:hypothetical protein